MKIIAYIVIALFLLPTLFAASFILTIPIIGLWWICLPIYLSILGIEFWSIGRVERETGRTRGPILVLIVQILLPFSPILLYPLIPGQMQSSEPFSGKAFLAVNSGIFLALLGFIAFAIVRESALQKISEEVEHAPPECLPKRK
jgi:hypothetical protein